MCMLVWNYTRVQDQRNFKIEQSYWLRVKVLTKGFTLGSMSKASKNEVAHQCGITSHQFSVVTRGVHLVLRLKMHVSAF